MYLSIHPSIYLPCSSPVSSPRVVEEKKGVDKETQIYPNDPEIFDFDAEVMKTAPKSERRSASLWTDGRK